MSTNSPDPAKESMTPANLNGILNPNSPISQQSTSNDHIDVEPDAGTSESSQRGVPSELEVEAKNKVEAKRTNKKNRSNFTVTSRLRPTEFSYESIVTEPVVTGQHSVNDQAFYQYDDLPFNRRGFKYRVCKPNPLFKATKYLTTELPPCKVRASYFDRSQGVASSEDVLSITTQNGWLSARCNVAIREGKYYFEYEIINANNAHGQDKAHVRVGLGRKELALDAPVGFDGYGYGLRDLTGQKITLSRPQEFMSEGFLSGDTIGFMINLPLLQAQKEHNLKFARELKRSSKKRMLAKDKAADEEEKGLNAFDNVYRDQIAIKYKNGLFFEQYEYTRTKQMDHLLNPVTVFGETAVLEQDSDTGVPLPTIPDSQILVYKNGQCVGEMFSNLYSFLPLDVADDAAATDANTKQQQNTSYRNTDDGSLGYYPMMSVFLDGIVKINAGPEFKHAIPHGATPLSERFDESVVEEWLWDVIDEVEAEYLDSFD